MNFLIFTILSLSQSFTQWSLSLSTTEIFQASSYTFSVKLSKPVSTSSYLQITFPSNFSSASLASLSCSSVFQVSSNLKCSKSDLLVTVTNLYSKALSSGSTIVLKLNGVINLSYSGSSSSFKIVSCDSKGQTIESLSSGLFANYTTKALEYFKIEALNKTVAALSTWIVSSYFSVLVGAGGVVSIDFPPWNSNFLPRSEEKVQFFNTNPECVIENNSENSTTVCEFLGNTIKLYLNSSFSGDFKAFISYGLSPPSIQAVNSVNVSVSEPPGSLLSFKNASIQSNTPCSIYPTITISSESQNSTADYTFTFSTCAPVNSKSSIKIEFPSDFSLTLTNTLSLFGLDLIYPTFSVTGQMILLTNLFTSYKSEKKIISFKLVGIRNPSISYVDGIVVSVLHSGYLSGQSLPLSIFYASESLYVNNIDAENKAVNATSKFFFNITTQSTVPKSAVLYIKIPHELTIYDFNDFNIIPVQGMLSSAEVTVTDGIIYITKAFDQSNSKIFSFYLTSFVNPQSTKPTSAFILRVYQDENKVSVLFQNSSYVYTAGPGELNDCFAQAGSYVTGDITEYSFGCSGVVYARGSFYIRIPEGMNLGITSSNCFGFTGFADQDYCENSEQSIEIHSSEAVSEEFSMKISNIKNPISTKPAVFLFFTYTDDGFVVQTANFTIEMNKTHEFKAISIEPSNKKVSEKTFYTLNFSQFNPTTSTGWLLIESSINLQSALCQSPYSCEYSSVLKIFLNQAQESFTIILKNIQNPESFKPFSFKITSFDPYPQDSSIVSYTLSVAGTLYSLNLTPNNTLIQSSISLSIDFIPEHSLLSADSFYIQFPSVFTNIEYNSNKQLSNDIVILGTILPISFTLTLPPSSNNYSILIQTLKDSYIIDQNTALFNVNCSVPCSNCSGSPTYCTQCSGSYPYLSSSTCVKNCPSGESDLGNKTCSACSLGCEKCSSFSSCQKCFDPYSLDSGSCLESCPVSKYSDNNECQPCSPDCLTCTTSKSFCTSCYSGQYLYKNTCTGTCDGLVINSICYDCDPSCKSCSGSIENCTSCVNGYFFSNKCYNKCPQGTMDYNDNCIKCELNCKTCSGWVNKCDSCYEGSTLISSSCVSVCELGYYYYQGNCLQCSNLCVSCIDSSEYCTDCVNGYAYKGLCLDSCPASVTIQSDQSCTDCLPNCQTCSISISNCLTCNPSYVLFNNTCIATCPDQYYNESNTCIQCPQNCSICDESKCIICDPPSLSYNNICVDSCPTGFYLSGTECLACNFSCLACSNSSNSCTECESPLLLLDFSCIPECPQHFVSEMRNCVPVICGKNCTERLLNNSVCDPECESEECDYDNKNCEVKDKGELKIDEEPFSFTTAGVVIGGISGTAAFFSTGTVLTAVSPVCGVFEFAGWVAVASEIGNSFDSGGRRLSEDYSQVKRRCLVGVLIVIIFKIIANVVAAREYSKLVTGVHLEWVRKHYKFCTFLRVLSMIVSFKLMAFLVSGICNWSIFSAKFEQPSKFFKLLLAFTAFSLIFLSIPMLCICLYILSIFPKNDLLYLLTADVFIITVLSIIISILSIFKYFRLTKVSKSANEMVSVAVPTAFEDIDFTSENSKPAYEDRYTIIKQYLDNLNTFEKQTIKKNLTKSRSLDLTSPNITQKVLMQSFAKSKLNDSPKEVFSENPSIIINNDEAIESELSISSIEIEMQPEHDFEFIEIDPEDFEIVRVKFKDIESVLCLRKSFDDGLFVDENRVIIEKQPKISIKDLELVQVYEENPALGLFRHKETGEMFRVLRCFNNAHVVKDRRKGQNYEFVLNSRRELVEKSEVKQGHPLFWKFENPQVKDRDAFV